MVISNIVLANVSSTLAIQGLDIEDSQGYQIVNDRLFDTVPTLISWNFNSERDEIELSFSVVLASRLSEIGEGANNGDFVW